MPKRYRAATIAAKLEEAHGNISAVARNLGIQRDTLYHIIKRHPTLQQVLANAREGTLDVAESVLYKKILDGEGWAVCFFLKTQGKARGYIERVDSRSESVNLNVDVSALNEAQLRRLAAGEEPVAVLAATRNG